MRSLRNTDAVGCWRRDAGSPINAWPLALYLLDPGRGCRAGRSTTSELGGLGWQTRGREIRDRQLKSEDCLYHTCMTAENDSAPGREKTWEPTIYNRFASQREEPFWELAGLLEPADAPRVVDLGCGDGRLTSALHKYLGASETLGIDSAPRMLESAAAYADGSVKFASGDIADWCSTASFDIIFANASLQWVADHRRVISSLKDSLVQGGQMALQVPSNADHAIYQLANQLGREWLGDDSPQDTVAMNVLKPEEYSELLESLGFRRQHVRLVVYGHHLSSTAQTVEWVKGTSLNRFKAVLSQADYQRFVERYLELVISELGDRSPYFFTFKRILMWASLSE